MTFFQQKKLLEWFYINQRSMPWRENPSPYRVWISEIMLQQTTVATVHSFFLRFMDRFPTLEVLAQAQEEDVLSMWAGLGYYTRAKNILKTAQIIQTEEKFPHTYDELLALPGIGPYTAGAICSIAFHQAVSLIDTNVDRVLGRFFLLQRQQLDFERKLRSHAQNLIEHVDENERWAWNQSIMEIGALVCKSKKTMCLECPLSLECLAYQQEDPLVYPGEKKKSLVTSLIEYAFVIRYNEKYLLSKITTGSRRLGLYDFPISNEKLGNEISRVNYRISNNKVTRIYCEIFVDEYKQQENDLWITLDDIDTIPLVSTCKKFFIKNS